MGKKGIQKPRYHQVYRSTHDQQGFILGGVVVV